MTAEWTNHVWQSTLFAGGAALLAITFRRNRAVVRYWLWFTASLKFLIPFSLLIGLGSRVDWAPAPRVFPAPPVTIAIEQITSPFSQTQPFLAPGPRSLAWRFTSL